MTIDQLSIQKLHALIDILSELTPDKQQKFLNELVEELEKDFKRRIQPPHRLERRFKQAFRLG